MSESESWFQVRCTGIALTGKPVKYNGVAVHCQAGKSASHVSVLLHEAHRGRTVTKKINFNSTMSGKTGSGSVSAKEKEKSDREKQKEKEKLAKEKTEKDRRGKRSESILGGPARNDIKDKDNLNDVFHDGSWVKMNLSCKPLYGL